MPGHADGADVVNRQRSRSLRRGDRSTQASEEVSCVEADTCTAQGGLSTGRVNAGLGRTVQMCLSLVG